MQGLSLRSRIHLRGALGTAQSAPWERSLWRWLGGAVAWSEAGYRVCAFWGLLDEPFQVKAICCLCPARGHLA